MVDLLVDYLEGTLPPDTEHDLDAHLAACTRWLLSSFTDEPIPIASESNHAPSNT